MTSTTSEEARRGAAMTTVVLSFVCVGFGYLGLAGVVSDILPAVPVLALAFALLPGTKQWCQR
ncbi:hypothetical protein [Mycolicibacterium sp. HK-90]|uniref:hypothetical protein n=1 Tax=Mycolicibacterium sp. HK-90 TaxID=3056937 RepID=UPI00265B075C|nr:hypothetical protein [Mycolicibacterium sp. HK-90]WKG02449.1 hypothetical protein QU592_25045 [Mycolicibacterium sp. HK-90]